ncbi:MAG: thiazole synthase [Candidatus Saganbacteria bacterium]|nr:thiazole synthase [Candidatus Saganbacteria bacterium]
MKNNLVIAGREFRSRLMLGTGKYKTFEIMKEALDASGCEIVTVAVRRVSLENTGEKTLLDHIDRKKYFILPNTAGCYSVDEAVRIARLAKAAGLTNWVKLEVIADQKYLVPDPVATIEAAKILIEEGFVVLPYTTDDFTVAKKLQEIGCATVMPGGSFIGSGQGVPNFDKIKVLRQFITVPVVVDSGIGCASDAALAMETGADACLINTAVAEAQYPALMAEAVRFGVEAGRKSFLSGRMPKKPFASASSPTQGISK